MGLMDDFRIWVRQWLGVTGISQSQQLSQDRINTLEEQMAVSQEDLDRINAATSRIAARVSSLLDIIDTLGTGNDDAVRAQAQQDAVLQASADLRPVIEQLESLGADASNVVPEPTAEQVPVEPGPDVAPVENAGTDPVTPADASSPGDASAPADAPASGDAPTFDESGIAVGESDPAPAATLDPAQPTDGTVVGDTPSSS